MDDTLPVTRVTTALMKQMELIWHLMLTGQYSMAPLDLKSRKIWKCIYNIKIKMELIEGVILCFLLERELLDVPYLEYNKLKWKTRIHQEKLNVYITYRLVYLNTRIVPLSSLGFYSTKRVELIYWPISL